MRSIDNLEIDKQKGIVVISVNPKIYPLDVIFSAAYIFLDKAYVLIDGDPEEEIIVKMKAKDKSLNLEELGREFNNELINYSFYVVQSGRTMWIRNAMIQRAFFSHVGEVEEENESRSKRKKRKDSD